MFPSKISSNLNGDKDRAEGAWRDNLRKNWVAFILICPIFSFKTTGKSPDYNWPTHVFHLNLLTATLKKWKDSYNKWRLRKTQQNARIHTDFQALWLGVSSLSILNLKFKMLQKTSAQNYCCLTIFVPFMCHVLVPSNIC